jgi:hypothetical protein
MMAMVLSHRPDGAHRRWFSDARDDGRRMEVSWHPDDGLVIISLWHGAICRSTFRLPATQAQALIDALAEPPRDGGPAGAVRAARAGRPEALLDMGRERLRRHVAQIVTPARRPKR